VDLREPVDELRSGDRPRLVLWPERAATPRSIALLAGSFDPITVAHVAMAEAAREVAELVVLVYAVRTLPKEGGAGSPLVPEGERIRTVAAVCASRPATAAGLCSHGLLADQVAAAEDRFPGAGVTLVVGSDKLAQLFDPRWYEDRDAALAGLFARADVRYAVRAGDDLRGALRIAGELGHGDRIRPLPVDPAVASVSSRTVREALRAGRDVWAWVAPEARDAVRRALG